MLPVGTAMFAYTLSAGFFKDELYLMFRFY